MTARQVGAYMLLLCHAWRGTTVGRMLNDPQRLMRLARLSPKEWAEDSPVIISCFDISDEKWLVQKRMVREWDKQQTRRAQAVEAGKRSGQVRRERPFNDRSTSVERKANTSSSSSSSSSVLVPPTPTGGEVLHELKTRIGAIFKRLPTARWNYADETALCEVARRPGVLDELSELEMAWVSKVEFLSRSAGAMLRDWDTNLDKARTVGLVGGNGKPAPKSGFEKQMARDMAALDKIIKG